VKHRPTTPRSRVWAALAPAERRTDSRCASYRDDRSSFIDGFAAPIEEADELVDSLLRLDSADGYEVPAENTPAARYRAASQRYRERQRYARLEPNYIAPTKGYPRGKWPRKPK
jgi:hypothetical protein